MSEEELRISDAERSAAADRLGEHLATGRITPEEHSERLDAIFAARTNSELAVPFRGLPEQAAAGTPQTTSNDQDIWMRLAELTSGLGLVFFFVCGFAFGGWAWAWIVFLLPGAFASISRR